MAFNNEKPPPYNPYPTEGETTNSFHNQPPNYPGHVMPAPVMNQQPPGFNGFPNYGSTTVVIQTAPRVYVIGGCPSCRSGILEDDFTCLGISLAIFCFPVGLLCCLAMRQRRCPACGAIFE
ncbi:Brain protein I3 [Halotydeus destructor]|nr:Brain protein I3 [Halotydeus destructor]